MAKKQKSGLIFDNFQCEQMENNYFSASFLPVYTVSRSYFYCLSSQPCTHWLGAVVGMEVLQLSSSILLANVKTISPFILGITLLLTTE